MWGNPREVRSRPWHGREVSLETDDWAQLLVAITLNDVPIDVLAERRSTTRGALYKTLHQARRKLRARLAQDGLAIEASHEAQRTWTRSLRVSSVESSKGDPMSTPAAINGSGGSDRTVLRSAIEREAELDMVAVSDVADADADALARLLTADSLPSSSASLTSAQKGSDLRRRPANGGSHGERPACTVQRGKESRAGDANPCMTPTHPSVAGLMLAVPFAWPLSRRS
jgi:hypothetical protein